VLRILRILVIVVAFPATASAQEVEPLQLHPIRFGFEGRFASAPNGAVLFEPGFDIAVRPAPHLITGVVLGGGTVALVDGDRWAFNVQPHAAFAEMIGGWLELYARGGVAIQMRDGGGISGGGAFAPFIAAGARVWLGGCSELSRVDDDEWVACMSIGYELRAQHHLAGGYLMMPAVLPEGSTTISSAFTLALEI
jgi:hypothetical protein